MADQLTQQQREALRLIEWMEFNAEQQKDWVARDSARYIRTYILNPNPNASELLEALENLFDVVYGDGGGEVDVHAQARAAIAKAHGETA